MKTKHEAKGKASELLTAFWDTSGSVRYAVFSRNRVRPENPRACMLGTWFGGQPRSRPLAPCIGWSVVDT